jgi:hypothetical protein
MWNEAVMASFEFLPWNLTGEAEGSPKNLLLRLSSLWSKI